MGLQKTRPIGSLTLALPAGCAALTARPPRAQLRARMNLVELASRIKSARLARGYTLDRVAELSGLGKGLLSKVENFRVTPSLPTLARLCEALGLSLDAWWKAVESCPWFGICGKGWELTSRGRAEAT